MTKIHSAEKQLLADLNTKQQRLYKRMEEETDLPTEIESLYREFREIEDSKARKIIFRVRSKI